MLCLAAKAVVIMWNAFEADRFDSQSFEILADSGLGILLTRRTCWVFCVAHGERENNRRQVYQKPQTCALLPYCYSCRRRRRRRRCSDLDKTFDNNLALPLCVCSYLRAAATGVSCLEDLEPVQLDAAVGGRIENNLRKRPGIWGTWHR